MRASIVIRSKDEADRLRLTLASLVPQTEKAEVVIVNDGSSDHTREVMAAAAQELEIVPIHHETFAGRSAAANAGAEKASGDIILFLDGDTIAEPALVEKHMTLHRRASNLVVRGEGWHLRSTRLFLDPEKGTPKPGEEARVMRMSENERTRAVVTRKQILENFSSIHDRAQPGIYPGFGPRQLFELEMEVFQAHPDCSVLWAAASGSNQSVRRESFLKSGGFHPDISINEHRELALRLCEAGQRMALAHGRTYHLIHRSGWRDPLQETEWERIFYQAHPIPEVALLPFLWASMSEASPFPKESLIGSLPELAELAKAYRGIEGLKSVRDAHMQATIGEQSK